MTKKKISQLPIASALDGTELVEIVQGGVNKKTTTGAVTGVRIYDVYTALLTQSGVGDPVATVLENTLGAVVWTRDGSGFHSGTLAGAFPEAKTFVLYGQIATTNGPDVSAGWADVNSVGISTPDGDGTIIRFSIEIRVYP